MLKLYQNIESVSQLDDLGVKKWLVKVSLNECTTLYRRLSLRRTEDLDSIIVADDNANMYDRELLELVLKLPQKYKDVIYLYYYEEYSIKEISEMLNCPQPTVKTRLRRGRSRLKLQLEDSERLGEII
jgi:RNA polymerase sigma-70 factor (ECF subfamily)